MTEDCVICNHKVREKIEQDIASGTLTKGAVAKELGISLEEVFYHMNNHFGRTGVAQCYKDHDSMDDETIESLYGKKKILEDIIMTLKDRVDGLKKLDNLKPIDTNNIMKTAQTLLKAVELLARLEGELKEEQRVTLEMYVALKSTVLLVTQKHPEIRKEIVEGVKDAEKKAVKVLKVEVPEEVKSVIP